MSFEKPRMETMAELRADHEADLKEITARYPTVASIVDDYRTGMLDFAEVSYRFPEKADQDEVIRLSGERNEAEGLVK